jgi:hypothetical protein
MRVPAHAMSIAESGILNDRDPVYCLGLLRTVIILAVGRGSCSFDLRIATCITRKGNPFLGQLHNKENRLDS